MCKVDTSTANPTSPPSRSPRQERSFISSFVTTTTPDQSKTASDDDEPEGLMEGSWYPLHPLAVLTMMPMLPTWFFLNRGFTQWFHWGIIFYMATGQTDFWRRFLVLQGGAVSVGWYAAVLNDWVVHGRFCHLLYNNMPEAMRVLMLTTGKLASGGIITNNATAVAALTASHIIDFLAHPFLTYVMWKMHSSRGGSMRNLVSWDVLLSAYGLSRVYSMTHQFYNNGTVTGLFYYGFDVYNIDNLDAYTAAYVAEGLFFLGMAGWKLHLQYWNNNLRLKIRIGEAAKNSGRGSSRKLTKRLSSCSASSSSPGRGDELDRKKPELMKSTSCFSTMDSSIMENDEDGGICGQQ